MGTRKTISPDIPEVGADHLGATDALKEAMEIGLQRRGDPLDGFVTFRDLVDGIGFDASLFGIGGDAGLDISGDPGSPPPGSPFLNPPGDDSDKHLPGRPANVRTASMWDDIMVLWDWPDEQGNPDIYWYGAIIWASATPSFANAFVAGYSTTNHFVHKGIGHSAPDIPGAVTQPGVRYYWVAWFGRTDPVTGVQERSESNPYQWENGIMGSTALDPEYVLEVLKGQITESQIYSTLNDRIDLVDFNDANPGQPFTGSVQSRILLAAQTVEQGVYGAIAEVATVDYADGQLAGEYSLRLDLDGYVVGFGLSAYAAINPITGQPGSRAASSTFIIKAQQFAIIQPDGGNGDEVFPFIVGTVNLNGVPTSAVGVDGQLIVHGTITADAILAGTIGVDQIAAQDIYTDLLTSDQLITGRFQTSVDPNLRLEINGRATQNELFPLWFGRGTTGGDESIFYFENNGTLRLAGELYVTGQGAFYAGNTASGFRWLSLGGPSDEFLLWAGEGVKSKTNPNRIFWIDNEGNAEFKGRVEAEFVSGEISRTFRIKEFGVITLPVSNATNIVDINDNEWMQVSEWVVPEPPFDAGHVPFVTVSFDLFGAGGEAHKAAAVRIMSSNGNLDEQGNQIWTERFTSIFLVGPYGSTHTLSALANNRVYWESYFRIDMVGFDGHTVQHGRRTGLVLGIR